MTEPGKRASAKYKLMFSHLLEVLFGDVELSLPFDRRAATTSVNVAVTVSSTESIGVDKYMVDIALNFDNGFITDLRKAHHVQPHEETMHLGCFMGLLLKSKAKLPVVAAQVFSMLGQRFDMYLLKRKRFKDDPIEAARAIAPEKMAHDSQLQDMVAMDELDGDNKSSIKRQQEQHQAPPPTKQGTRVHGKLDKLAFSKQQFRKCQNEAMKHNSKLIVEGYA